MLENKIISIVFKALKRKKSKKKKKSRRNSITKGKKSPKNEPVVFSIYEKKKGKKKKTKRKNRKAILSFKNNQIKSEIQSEFSQSNKNINYIDYTLSSENFSNHHFVLPEKYEPEKFLGSGSYGKVIQAFDKEAKKHVAIKKVENLKQQNKFFLIRMIREILVLAHLKNHDNCIELLDLIFPPGGKDDFNDVYIVTDLMESDLRALLNKGKIFSDQFTKFIIYQSFRALKYVHSANILHRDLKPANILINSDLDIKVCDYGLSRGFEFGDEFSKSYVITKHYRPPELDLFWETMLPSQDVWSLGCIFAELLSEKKSPVQKILFKSKNYIQRINEIMSLVGAPKTTKEIFGCDKAKNYLKNIVKSKAFKRKDFKEVFPNANPLAVDLLGKMLVWNPYDRISVEKAMKHPYFKEIYEADFNDTEAHLHKTLKQFKYRADSDSSREQILSDLHNLILDWNKKKNGKTSFKIVGESEKFLK